MHHEHVSLRCLDVLLVANAKLNSAKSWRVLDPPLAVEAEKQITNSQIKRRNGLPKTSVSVSTDSLLANDVSYMLVLSSYTGAARGVIAQILHPHAAEWLRVG